VELVAQVVDLPGANTLLGISGTETSSWELLVDWMDGIDALDPRVRRMTISFPCHLYLMRRRR
jgi:hypothetical protein